MLAGTLLVVGAVAVTGCGSSSNEAEKQDAQQAAAARAAAGYVAKTASLAVEVARLPRTMNKPKKTITQAKDLESQARELERYPEQAAAGSTGLEGANDDLAAANGRLARAAQSVQEAAVEVRDASREPELAGAERNLRRANRLMESAYTSIDAFVTAELAGSVTVEKPPDVTLAKVKLPPLPDLIFNFTDAGDAQVGDWRPSPVNAEFQDAVAVFGAPDVLCSEQKQDNVGTNEWQALGLEVMQADLGIGDPCEGSVQAVEIRGDSAKQWVTEAGLRVGDPESKVYDVYPNATESQGREPDGTTGITLAVTGGGVPRDFVALMKDGSVVGMRMWIGGAGE